jgi:hypothetical protein
MPPKLLRDGVLTLDVIAVDCVPPSPSMTGGIQVVVKFTQGDHVLSMSPPMNVALGKSLGCDIGRLLREATNRVLEQHFDPANRKN